MSSRLDRQARAFRDALAELVKRYQFRDRNETVALGLSVSQAYALGALSRHGPLTASTLAADLHLSPSATTRVADSLVDAGLALRRDDPDDRRVCRVEATARGRRLWRRLERDLLDMETEVLRTLTAPERDAVVRALRRLTEATDAWRARQRG